jgi:hypothetical protein
MNDQNPMPAPVLQAFRQVPTPMRATLLEVRRLIFDVANDDPRIGPLEEALRWGEPAYLTQKNKTGSTIRLGVEKASGKPALFFNCQTTLVEDFRTQFGGALTYSKNRAVLIDKDTSECADALKICITAALTYHLRP